MLGSIVKEGATRLSRSIWEISKGKVETKLSGMKSYAKEAGNALFSRVGLQKSRKTLLQEMEAITAEAAALSAPEAEEDENEKSG